jgi:hypothetical protein
MCFPGHPLVWGTCPGDRGISHSSSIAKNQSIHNTGIYIDKGCQDILVRKDIKLPAVEGMKIGSVIDLRPGAVSEVIPTSGSVTVPASRLTQAVRISL